jgi:hypothetical protein
VSIANTDTGDPDSRAAIPKPGSRKFYIRSDGIIYIDSAGKLCHSLDYIGFRIVLADYLRDDPLGNIRQVIAKSFGQFHELGPERLVDEPLRDSRHNRSVALSANL